jgi:hypothetical protein
MPTLQNPATGLILCIGATRRDVDFERELAANKRTLQKVDEIGRRAII